MSTVILSGNPRPDSRTLSVARLLADHLDAQIPAETVNRVTDATAATGGTVEIELSEFAGDLLVRPLSDKVQDAVAAVLASERLLVATPSYKGSFTGLLKCFIDLFAADSVTVPTYPVVVAASPRHVVSTTEHLAVVLGALGAEVRTGVAALETELDDPAGYLPSLDPVATTVATPTITSRAVR